MTITDKVCRALQCLNISGRLKQPFEILRFYTRLRLQNDVMPCDAAWNIADLQPPLKAAQTDYKIVGFLSLIHIYHPIKAIYTRRMNTILQSTRRGKLDEETAAAMKKLAKDKMLRALSDQRYASTVYEREMTQQALLEAVQKK